MSNKHLGAILWILPMAVFLYSGMSKFSLETAQQPEILSSLFTSETYAKALLVIGGIEIIAALMLTWQRIRSFGIVMGMGLLTMFSMVIASSATDESFLANCGCGGLISEWKFMQNANSMLIRNAVLALFLALCAKRGVRLSSALGVMAVMFASLLASEKWRSGEDRGVLSTLLNEKRGQRTGWMFPDIQLKDRNGKIVQSSDVLRPNDGLMLFSVDCAHCRDAARSWAGLRDKLRTRGGRLVAIQVDATKDGVHEFLTEYGLDGVEHFTMQGIRDLLALGVSSVPHFLSLGKRQIVTWQTNGFVNSPAHLAIGSFVGPESVLCGLAARMFGPGKFELIGEPAVRSGVTMGKGIVDGEEIVLAIGQNRPSDTFRAECGFAIGRDGKIREVEPIVWLVGLTGFEEPQPYLEKLRGMTLPETEQFCRKLVTVDQHGHVWLALEGVVSQVSHSMAQL